MRIAVYAGTFDPVTFGHLDVIRRAAAVFDRVIVATTAGTAKATLFSVDQRLEMLRTELAELPAVEVAQFDGLLVDFARDRGASVLVRGLRAASDFEYEFGMAMMNRALAPDLETVFLITSPELMFVSSSLIREVARSGGSIEKFVPGRVRDAIMSALSDPARRQD